MPVSLLDRTDRLHIAAGNVLRQATFGLTVAEAEGGAGNIYQQAEDFRRRMAKGELQAIQTVLSRWESIQRALRDQIDELVQIMVDPNVEMTVAQGRALDRLSSMDRQITRLVSEYAAAVEADLTGLIFDVGQLGADQAETLIRLQIPAPAAGQGITFDRLPRKAVEQLAASTAQGPLRTLLSSLAPDLVDLLATELTDGIGLGRSPRVVAERLVQAAGMPRWRALNIARTETLRAYREASRLSAVRNSKIVKGWVWSASLDNRTCPVCWAMHGTEFPSDEIMATHPSCRCDRLPVTVSWDELGFEDIADAPILQVHDGPELFARQGPLLQAQVLGPAKFAAYQRGLIDLPDLVGVGEHPDWGPYRYERPLTDLLPEG